MRDASRASTPQTLKLIFMKCSSRSEHCDTSGAISDENGNIFISEKRVMQNILQRRHNERDGSGNDWRLGCISNRLFRRRSKKTSMLRVTVFVRRIHRWSVNSPHKGPVTRKMFLFKDVIMNKNDVLQKDHTTWLFYIYGSGTWKLQECKCAWWWMMESLECKLT